MEEERFDFVVNIDIDNSQDSNHYEIELGKIKTEAKPANTKRNTSWGIMKF